MRGEKKKKAKNAMETLQRFGIAGTAGCGATCVVHPLDVLRVNLQVTRSEVSPDAEVIQLLQARPSLAFKGSSAASGPSSLTCD